MLRPDVRVAEDVRIDVIRNPNAPQFGSNFYVETISESEPQGTSVLDVAATDADSVSWSLNTSVVFIIQCNILPCVKVPMKKINNEH